MDPQCFPLCEPSLFRRVDLVQLIQHYRRGKPITDGLLRAVHARACKLDWRAGDRGLSIPAIENRLALAVFRASDTWDPTRFGYERWVRGAIDFESRKIADELHRRNLRRGKEDSLDRDLDDSGQSGLVIDLVDTRNTVERFYRVIDARACAESLPGEDREIFKRVAAGYSRREIAWILGYDLHEFYERVWPMFVEKVRRWYRDAR
ncbi:MAG: hypothetical protein PUE68_03140 [Kiritimatiellae bacterium]|nr:hypothetical protein [Kiritimatiellia bacterium]